MTHSLVSIILSVYNAEKYIEDCLNSIAAQTYKDWELVVINDGSTDKSNELITKFVKSTTNTVQYLNLDINKGLSYCLNLGISHAKGKYIARIDADDLMLKMRLEGQVRFLEENTKTDILGGSAIEIDEKGIEIGVFKVPLDDFNIKKMLLSTYPNPIIHPTVMMKKSIFLTGIDYRSLYPNSEDIDLWLRLSKTANFSNLDMPLIKKRTHSEQITMSKRSHYDCLRAKVDFFLKNGILLKNLHHLIRHIIVILFIPNALYVYLKKDEQRKRRDNYNQSKR